MILNKTAIHIKISVIRNFTNYFFFNGIIAYRFILYYFGFIYGIQVII